MTAHVVEDAMGQREWGENVGVNLGRWITIAAALAVSLIDVAPGQAQQYPDRNVTMVVPFPPGGTTDIVARILTEQLSADLGRQVVVENRGGASTSIGAQYVAGADKDGYTLLFASATTFTTNPHLLASIKYTLEDFAPVAMVVKVPFAFVVKKDFPAADVAAFRAYALANPGKVNNATNGPGSTVHLMGEVVARGLGVKLQHVHYRGAAPAMNDMLAGVVDSNVEALTNTVPNHKAGTYRALAVLSEERLPQIPEVPSFKELGYPGIVGATWFAVFAPAGTPQAVLDRLSAAITRIVKTPDFAKRMEPIGNQPWPMTPNELDAHVRGERDRLGKIIREANITVD
ncbi:MAG: tripartite tricarboxylate transporter substrate binding protein [Hyphomicrobiales bacterium]|jgi:tripartite-type tricarboxylate transporter receptor subunit TctC|nr:tripartite tricarboxylate transporter substrate binding protein [Hyphomicrobiales bacterium]